uniref:Selenoprotein T n=1 Tax=Denticeps clupeoides TaxID=299321 RepID=A0AAY4CUS2_9TELE
MAEYSQAGILTALLFFSAVTLRDVYLGRGVTQHQQQQQQQQQQQAAEVAPESLLDELQPPKPSKHKMYAGPVLRFQYWYAKCYSKVFQEYSRAIGQVYPDIRIEGDNYPPKTFNKYMANFVSYFKLLIIALVVSGQNPFQMFGMATPRLWSWAQDNKIFSCLMAFFLSNMLETHFLSTGAFEITLNDIVVWSKLQSGYVPNIQELFQILDNHLKMSQGNFQ